jgi:hypothetical protein
MSDQAQPLIRLDNEDAKNAPSLSYDVPDPTSFPGRSYISLDFGDLDPFSTEAVVSPGGQGFIPASAVPFSRLSGRFGPPQLAQSEAGAFIARGVRGTGIAAFTAAGAAGTDINSTTGLLTTRLARTSAQSSKGGDEGPDPHDPSDPQAVVSISTPPEGTVLECGPNGFDLVVVVHAKFKFANTVERSQTAAVTVNGSIAPASRSGDPGPQTRTYSATVHVLPGPVSISARLDLAGNSFQTASARNITVKLASQPATPADSTPPLLTLDAPVQGLSLTIGEGGTTTLQVRGTVTDTESKVENVRIILDGAAPIEAPADPSGTYSSAINLAALGVHELVVTSRNAAGLTSQVTRQFSITDVKRIPRHRLMIVECLRLSNFLGRYGAGRIVQTFSLLPGEKTSITIRTFNTKSETSAESSSIFDSYSETTGDELNTAITNEDTSKSQSEEDLKAHVNVKAGATWGWGSASVEAGLAYGTSSAREQLTKNVTNGAAKHAAEKSSKRDVKVDSTKTVTTTSENEQTIVRTLENSSLAHTLNFTFRQMTQEFISLLHLVDIRFAHLTEWFEVDGTRSMVTPDPAKPDMRIPRINYEEVALPQLSALLQRICASTESAGIAESIILRQLDAVFDYEGDLIAVVEEVDRQVPSRDSATGKIRTREDPDHPGKLVPVFERLTWTRFDPGLKTAYKDGDGPDAFSITVAGVVLGVTKNSLRTDGVVVDCFLGGGTALDGYGTRLQTALARVREAEADHAEKEANRLETGLDIISETPTEKKAETYAEIFPAFADARDGQQPG